MKTYKNISKVSGVDSYEFGSAKGYGLKQLLIDLKPTPVEKLIPDM